MTTRKKQKPINRKERKIIDVCKEFGLSISAKICKLHKIDGSYNLMNLVAKLAGGIAKQKFVWQVFVKIDDQLYGGRGEYHSSLASAKRAAKKLTVEFIIRKYKK